MPARKNYSRKFQGREELIDHILVSAALVKELDAIQVEAVIDQTLPSISTNPSERRSDPHSDHAPIVASFSDL
jgi:exonuclease III